MHILNLDSISFSCAQGDILSLGLVFEKYSEREYFLLKSTPSSLKRSVVIEPCTVSCILLSTGKQQCNAHVGLFKAKTDIDGHSQIL